MVTETALALNQLGNKVQYLTLSWTRGHVGNVGNERADELAKIGTTLSEEMNIGKPVCYAKNKIRVHFEDKWNSEWLGYKEARMSKQFIKSIDMGRSKKILKYGRRKIGTLVRIITGHNRLNYFGSKVDKDLDPTCRFCGEDDETFWHFATDCPVFRQERDDCFHGWSIENGVWEPEELVDFANVLKIAKSLEGYSDIWFGENDNESVYSNENRPDPEPD